MLCRVQLTSGRDETTGIARCGKLPRIGETIQVVLKRRGLRSASVDAVRPGDQFYDAYLAAHVTDDT